MPVGAGDLILSSTIAGRTAPNGGCNTWACIGIVSTDEHTLSQADLVLKERERIKELETQLASSANDWVSGAVSSSQHATLD